MALAPANDRGRLIGIGSVLLAALIWGTTGTAASFAPDLHPAAIGAAAMGIGGLLQAAIAAKAIRAAWPRLLQNWRLLLLGGVAVAIYPLAFYASMRLSGVAIGTVVTIGSAPLFSAAIEFWRDNLRLGRQWAVGLALGITGILLMCLAKQGGSAAPTHVSGIWLGLLAGLTYALYSWTARRVMQGGTGSWAAMGATFGIGGLMLMPVLFAMGGGFLDSRIKLAVGAYMALVPMFVGYLCFGYGLARVQASTATTISLFEPVVAAALAVLIVGERLSPAGWVGVAFVIACLICITLPGTRTAPAQPSRR